MSTAGARRVAALLLLMLALASTAALATRDGAQVRAKKPSPSVKKPYVPSPSVKKPAKPYVPSPAVKNPPKPYAPSPSTKPGSGGSAGGGGVIPTIPGFGSIPGFNEPGMGGGWGGGFGGPDGGYSRAGVVASTTVCSEKGPCYKKKLTCPKKCFESYSGSGKGYGGGGGGGGCTVDCKSKCIAYC